MCTIYVKCEFFNPAASVKDRLALNIIEAAERDGTLKPGQTVVEATSGNTGIGLAMVCAAKGYPLVVTMADSVLGRAAAADALPRRQGGADAAGAEGLRHVHEGQGAGRHATAGSWRTSSRPPANADIHESTTAAEILADFKGQRLDYFVSGYGTGGTVAGVGRVLKKSLAGGEDHPQRAGQRPARRLGHRRSRATRTASRPASHPAFEPHPIQGWTPDFIPLVLQEAIDGHYYDELIPIAGRRGDEVGARAGRQGGDHHRRLRRRRPSASRCRWPRRRRAGSVILAMLPDTGERYLSTPLFEPFGADMNEEELEVMRSTPGYQLG